ncbi:hypothetical protein LSCM1_02620 [Leishmania martiniquensis]|uniref:Major facilitator superfamily (MFS) profile domain-containing protein n=1 Tax=Leishmania martiniquensis TaxID=1580590 RepID=A0A836KKU3_9TRYP|nr:hypothetical protein LSCM1_02620 [Leishmania martiniquensis]
MPRPVSFHDRRGEEVASGDNLSTNSCGSRPSTLNSPNRSWIDVSLHSLVFSTSSSFAGVTGKIAVPTAAVASAGPGQSTEVADAIGSASVTPATAVATAVTVDMTPAIIGYFSSAFGSGICSFCSRIFQAKGFSAYEIGILVSANPLMNMTLLPVLSYLADKFRCQTAMSLVSTVLATVSTLGYTASDGRVVATACFLVMTASRVLLGPLLDQRILMMFPKEERSSSWSYVRSYAAYGWGIGSFVSALIFSYTGSWVPVTIQYVLGQVGLAYCMLVIQPYERIERVRVQFVEVLKLLGGSRRLMLFLLAATMMGTGYSFIDNFLFLFLGDLGGSETLMGLTVILTVSTEIPLFQMSARLHRMFTERQMMTIAMSVWVFRVTCYAMLTKAWMVLLIEPLHGVTFAFMWLPSVQLISRAFPRKLSSSATGVLFTLTSGVGPMVGNLVAGTLYTLVGPHKMFLYAAAAMTSALIFYQLLDRILERRGLPVSYDQDAGPVAVTAPTMTVDKARVQAQTMHQDASPHPPNVPGTTGDRPTPDAPLGSPRPEELDDVDTGQRRKATRAEIELSPSFMTSAADSKA